MRPRRLRPNGCARRWSGWGKSQTAIPALSQDPPSFLECGKNRQVPEHVRHDEEGEWQQTQDNAEARHRAAT